MPQTLSPAPRRITATRSRQASWGRHLLIVLLVSTGLATAVLFAMLAMTPLDSHTGGGPIQVTPEGAPISAPGAPH